MDEGSVPPGPPTGSYNPPPPPSGYPPPYSGGPPPSGPPRSGSQGTTALILGILGVLPCCHVLAPVAWYLGHEELREIRAGRVHSTETNAQVGRILGIVGTAFLALGIMWACFFGGFGVLGRLIGGHMRGMGGHGF